MGVKDLFLIRKENTNIESPKEDVKSGIIAPIITFTFNEWGRQQAEAMGGRAATLPPAIHAAHRKIIQQVKGDEIQQAQRRAEIQSKIDILKSENENLSNKKSQKDKELQHEESKIEEAKAEVAAIRNDPSRVTKQQGSPMVSFIIGLIIIILLTIYLFVFYSSTAFSAFFKEYAPSDLGVLGKIFDAQAIPEAIAMSQGGFPTALVFIITIPAVFLGLGYLIHRISNDPNSTKLAKYIKTGSLLLVTFAFDALLAEQIDENIYNAIKNNSFEYMADFKFTMAFQDARFWMIIFAGFIVYLIWGLVFNFIMEEYFKLDRVKVAIEELEKKNKSVQDHLQGD